MIAFTILGLLVFWLWCFELGYVLIPIVHVVRWMWSLLWLDFAVEAPLPRVKSLFEELQEGAP